MYEYSAELYHVVDGDTVDLNVDLGFKIYTIVRFRLDNIDAPEKKTPTLVEGKASQAHLEQILNASIPWSIRVKCTGKDKYGRWIAHLSCVNAVDGTVVDVNQKMIDDGFAAVSVQ